MVSRERKNDISTPIKDPVGDDGVSVVRHFWTLDLHLMAVM